MRWAAPVVVLVLIAAASYEAAIALQWLDIRPLPGAGREEEEEVLVAAVVAQFVGAVLLASNAIRRRTRTDSIIPLAAAAFMTARFYTFDPYYAPTLRRMSDGGFVATEWVYVLVVCSLLAGAVTLARPRVGSGVAAVVVVLCALTAFVMGIGH